ncbi:MAG: hypothetical protein F6J86_43290 [Symploca sp. SIO1B1]|nr:hypothetical protein [Symploca sp. SIO1B1]
MGPRELMVKEYREVREKKQCKWKSVEAMVANDTALEKIARALNHRVVIDLIPSEHELHPVIKY